MDILDPGVEVWVCVCGMPVSERGLCLDCAMQEADPILCPPVFIVMAFVILSGMAVAVAWMMGAAWGAYQTFGG